MFREFLEAATEAVHDSNIFDVNNLPAYVEGRQMLYRNVPIATLEVYKFPCKNFYAEYPIMRENNCFEVTYVDGEAPEQMVIHVKATWIFPLIGNSPAILKYPVGSNTEDCRFEFAKMQEMEQRNSVDWLYDEED